MWIIKDEISKPELLEPLVLLANRVPLQTDIEGLMLGRVRVRPLLAEDEARGRDVIKACDEAVR